MPKQAELNVLKVLTSIQIKKCYVKGIPEGIRADLRKNRKEKITKHQPRQLGQEYDSLARPAFAKQFVRWEEPSFSQQPSGQEQSPRRTVRYKLSQGAQTWVSASACTG